MAGEAVIHAGNGGSGGLVVTELAHIKELVRQLDGHLQGGSQSQELCKHLASQIFAVTERSIGLITDAARKRSAADAGLASPLSATPTSDLTDGPFKNTKKRKLTEARRLQVRVGSAAETPVDDGHSWRKYGQKEILGAKNPRGYYRCTHRHSLGCLATKQVQRTDEDPALFDVIYHGDHTCLDKAAAAKPEQNPDARSLLQSLTAGLTVKTEGLPAPTTPFCFSATPASAPSTSENWGVSPATSDSNHVASYLPFEDAEWRAQAELQEVVSALMSASAPPPPLPAMDSLDESVDFDITSFLL